MRDIDQSSNAKLISIKEYIQDPDSNIDDQYTILKHCRRSVDEIAEIASALGTKHIVDIVTLNPRRLALYETIVTVQTEVSLENQEELEHVFREVYRNCVVPLLKKKDPINGKKLETKLVEEVENEINPLIDKCVDYIAKEKLEIPLSSRTILTPEELKIIEEIKNIDEQITHRIREGSYIPGNLSFNDNKESITRKIIFDKLYNRKIQRKVKNIVHSLIDQHIDGQIIYYPYEHESAKKSLERLKRFKGEERYTFMMIGAPASGKSTSYALVIVDAMALGIQERDMIKCNTDSYRPLVSNSKELGDNQRQYASYNYDESYLITKKIYHRIQEKITQEEGAPHLLIDSVYPTQEKINLGLLGQGNLSIYCITVPTEVSLSRAHHRGEQTGRYIDTALLLQSHRDISANFHTILKDNKEQSLTYVIFDNNVLSEELPILVVEGNLKDKSIKVHSLIKLKEFIEKRNINTDGTRMQEYTVRDTITLLEEFQKEGFRVEFSNISDRILVERNQSLSIRRSLEKLDRSYSPISIITSHSPREVKERNTKQSDKEVII